MSNTLDSNPPEPVAPREPSGISHQQPSDDLLQVDVRIDHLINLSVGVDGLVEAVRTAASYRGILRGEIGVRICGDATIHDLNRTHLGHDYPTDVISFCYAATKDHLSGELVASFDTALRRAGELLTDTASSDDERRSSEWSATAELLLYVVHGTLHITGMDDQSDADRAEMRAAEQAVMTQLGWPQVRIFGADGDACVRRSSLAQQRFPTEEQA